MATQKLSSRCCPNTAEPPRSSSADKKANKGANTQGLQVPGAWHLLMRECIARLPEASRAHLSEGLRTFKQQVSQHLDLMMPYAESRQVKWTPQVTEQPSFVCVSSRHLSTRKTHKTRKIPPVIDLSSAVSCFSFVGEASSGLFCCFIVFCPWDASTSRKN